MAKKYNIPVLTPVEREVYHDQLRINRRIPKCDQCVNGQTLWKIWICGNGLEWPSCKNVPNGGYQPIEESSNECRNTRSAGGAES